MATNALPSVIKTITREQLQQELDSVVLLEALPASYYTAGHLPGAKWFPVEQARDLAWQYAPEFTTPVVVYCASETCRNSHQVARMLEGLGYHDVRVYTGGKADWQDAGLPLER